MGIFVVFCSFAALALGPGLLNAYGVYEEEYDRLFDNKDGGHYTSALGSPVIFIGIIQIFLANGTGFIGGHCTRRFGPGPSVFAGGILMSLGLLGASYSRQIWQLCLTQGFLFGLGACLVWIPAASAPSSWFDKNRGVATGITHMGLGVGGLVFAPVTRFLLEKSGTGGSLRWLSLIILISITAVSLAKEPSPAPKEAAEPPISTNLLKSWRFWLLSVGVGTGQAAWYIVLLFMASVSVSVGLDVHNAAIVLGSVNGASAVGQFMAGYAADIVGPVNSLLIFTALATISNVILFVPRLSLHLLIAYACLCGASIGAADPLAVMANVTQFGRARAATTTGFAYGSVGVFVAILVPNARIVLETIGGGKNFAPVHVFTIIIFAASSLLLLLLRLNISHRLFVRV
ncbi:major facilitator superfamily domain-containing protein [Coemansia spiralis]|nr:major facilitator superfamily domain-containing protein [Coemansia spiralis]